MKLLIINVFFLLIAFKAFAVPGGNSPVADHWGLCNAEKNGPIILEKACERLLLCYQSNFSTGRNSKVGRRFRSKIGMNGDGLFAECAEVMESEGWHALIIGKMSDGMVAFESSLRFGGFFVHEFITETPTNTEIQIFSNANDGLLEKDFQTDLYLGAFMDDFNGMALQILASDLLSTIGRNGTKLCQKKCSSPNYDGTKPTTFPFNATDAQNAVTEQSRLTTAPWNECKLEKNGLFKLEKGCKTLQICYKSKLAGKLASGGTSKFGGRFLLGKRVNERPFSDCAGVVARNEWHALNVSKISDRTFTIQSSLGLDGQFVAVYDIKWKQLILAMNISKHFGAIETDFLKALHLGPFMKDFDAMAFRILALDLLSSIGQNGTGLCKKTCALEPTTWKNDHFGTNCTEIVFPEDVPKFVLDVSASPYLLVCNKHEFAKNKGRVSADPYKDYVIACMQVSTEKCKFQVEVYACYKSSRNWPGSSSIAELCRKHLDVDSTSNVAGFRVRICVHREGQFLVVESFFKLSFSDETFNMTRNFPITLDGISAIKKKMPIFFLEFGNGQQQSAIRQKPGGEKISGSNRNVENDGIGSVLDDIKREKINGSWAKKLHFVPPSTRRMELFFQIANTEFSKRITRGTLTRYENNPGITIPTPCVGYGDDCDEIRELLKRIEDLESCHGNKPILPDDAFKLPPWKKPPPASPFTPFKKRSESLMCYGGDLPCDKKSLHEEYIKARERCGLAPEKGDRRKTRQYSPKGPYGNHTKWTEFPIKIGFFNEFLPDDYEEWKTAITEATNLIINMRRFEIVEEIPEIQEGVHGIGISNRTGGCGRSSAIGRTPDWQEVMLAVKSTNPFCQQFNVSMTAAHELLHALGLFHEFQQRDARNFSIIRGETDTNEWPTENFGFAYDFGSVMHYPGQYNKYTKQYWLITLPRFYQETIGHMESLSFKDTALINRIFCNDTCKEKDWCENGGYLNPNDCSKCLCPGGFTGPYCRLLEMNLNCEDTSGTPRELEAERTNKVLKPMIKCGGSGPTCRCYWRIKANGKKARIQLINLNKMLECVDPCKNYVLINYRKDKRAQGARLCCPGALHDGSQNAYKNWIEAEEPNVDFIISTHISTVLTKPTTLFELNYEAGAVNLTDSCDCVSPENLFKEKRNPGSILECHDKFGRLRPNCLCYGNAKCLLQEIWCNEPWHCPVFVINGGQIRKIMSLKDYNAHPRIWSATIYCFRPEGASKSFWGYRENATADPIRVDEIQCLHYEEAGVKPPKFKSLDVEHRQFNQGAQTINATVWGRTKNGG